MTKSKVSKVNSKLNIDEPIKAIEVIDFLFFYFVLGLIVVLTFF